MPYQELARLAPFVVDAREELVELRARALVSLESLCDAFAAAASRPGASGIERALDLRARPAPENGVDRRSLYECLNQVVHVAYCAAAGLHLWDLGFTRELRIVPTAHGSGKGAMNKDDLRGGRHDGACAIGEVFCVSPALWAEKLRDTRSKLQSRSDAPDAYAFIYFNAGAGTLDGASRAAPLIYAALNRDTGAVESMHYGDPRGLPTVPALQSG